MDEKTRRGLTAMTNQQRAACAVAYCVGVLSSDKSEAEKKIAREIGSTLQPEALWYIKITVTVGKVEHDVKHSKDCELGDNWKDCPACLESRG